MKLILLTKNENIELYQKLKQEFITDSYEQYIQSIVHDICQELQIDISTIVESDLYIELCQTVIAVINKIWLDNIMKYIVHANIHTFMTLINYKTLGQDIFVNSFYACQITDIFTKYFNLHPEELDSITNILVNRLRWIINCMYVANLDRYNEILTQAMNNIYLSVGNIQVKYYKFELDQYFRPLLFYIEKESNETFCTQ